MKLRTFIACLNALAALVFFGLLVLLLAGCKTASQTIPAPIPITKSPAALPPLRLVRGEGRGEVSSILIYTAEAGRTQSKPVYNAEAGKAQRSANTLPKWIGAPGAHLQGGTRDAAIRANFPLCDFPASAVPSTVALSRLCGARRCEAAQQRGPTALDPRPYPLDPAPRLCGDSPDSASLTRRLHDFGAPSPVGLFALSSPSRAATEKGHQPRDGVAFPQTPDPIR